MARLAKPPDATDINERLPSYAADRMGSRGVR